MKISKIRIKIQPPTDHLFDYFPCPFPRFLRSAAALMSERDGAGTLINLVLVVARVQRASGILAVPLLRKLFMLAPGDSSLANSVAP
jgi:hypothetical protein